jgi:chemotaxis protein methyltransferase CheR
MLNITNEQFDRVRSLSLSLAGIQLSERHRELLVSRCRRLKIEDPASLIELLGAAEKGDGPARQRLIGLFTTSHTGFFRNPGHFAIAGDHALRAIHKRGRARLWSAAAATGEEPYSLAIALMDAALRDDPPVTILATDINSQVLEFAKRGEYSEVSLRSLDTGQRARFFSESSGSGNWRISRTAGRLIEFRELNLNSEIWPVDGPFDVVLCRNLLMYLDTHHRHLVLQRMASLIAPDGLLILDPAEHLGKSSHLFGSGSDGVYPRHTAQQGGSGTIRIRHCKE